MKDERVLPKDERQRIRQKMLALRKQLTPDERNEAGAQVLARLLQYEPYRRARTVMLYAAMAEELPTGAILEELQARGIMTVLPRTVDKFQMIALEAKPGMALEPGRFGVMEPPMSGQRIPSEAIDLVLVPGLAFDARGGRLGYGAGYYDRYLQGTACHRIGIGYAFAQVGQLPLRAWDVPMDALVTDAELKIVGKGERA